VGIIIIKEDINIFIDVLFIIVMLIALTGRIAAGKEILTKFLIEQGFEYLETAQLLKAELIKRGLEINRWNMQNLGDDLRDKEGVGVLMKIF